MKIILGSQSLGRRKMLTEMGIDFDVMTADIDEKAIRCSDPKELVLSLANAKADAIVPRISEPAILITSDRVVVWNGVIREKPESENEAREYLSGYNNFPAETVTAVVVTNLATGKRAEAVDIAKVYFNAFSENDINNILIDGNVFRFAGGFTVDGPLWEPHISKIEGTRDSVIGLPKDVTQKLISDASV